MTREETPSDYRAEGILCAILLFSAFLNFWNVWNQGFSNTYYAAAVRSMLENPGIAFFNSFDAAGFITVDKPPVGLWVQAVSAAIFGFSGWALVLPQALAGVGSVALVYLIVHRPFGKPAGLVSAFALAVTPVFVAVSRNGTMDGILIFVLLLALWLALKAAREQSFLLFLLSVLLIGIGFNIKMIQAFIIVPAVFLVYLIGMRRAPGKKQVLHLCLGILLLAVVSLSWAVAVDCIPATERPYIGGSGDNTVLGLIINYNGLHRLENGAGAGNSPGGSPVGAGIQPAGQNRTSFMAGMPQNRTAGGPGSVSPDPAAMMEQPGLPDQNGPGQPPAMPDGPPGTFGVSPGGRTVGGSMDNSGSPGLFRLFNSGLAGQISWLLPFALIGLLAWLRRPASLSMKGLDDAGLFTERGQTLLAAGLWLLPGLIYFSFTTGFWHTYYIATIAPPLGMLVGISTIGLHEAWVSTYGVRGWLLAGAVAVTGFFQVLFLSYSEPWSTLLLTIVIAAVLTVCILLAVLKLRSGFSNGNRSSAIAAAAIAVLFLATTVWAFTPLMYGDGGTLPVAGPQQNRGTGGMGNAFSGTNDRTPLLADYLLSHRTGETWIVAVPSSMGEGANLIIETGEPVMSLGGFSGSDQTLTVDSLKGLIDQGKIRYFLGSPSGGGGGMGGGNSALFTWVSEHCAVVPAGEWGSGTGNTTGLNTLSAFNTPLSPATPGSAPSPSRGNAGIGGSNTLYDCAGYTGKTSS